MSIWHSVSICTEPCLHLVVWGDSWYIYFEEIEVLVAGFLALHAPAWNYAICHVFAGFHKAEIIIGMVGGI